MRDWGAYKKELAYTFAGLGVDYKLGKKSRILERMRG
jgi:hypothetical protein